MKIDKLTKEQEAQFPVYAKKWLDIGLSTEPANKELAELAVKQAYEVGSKKAPEIFIWCDSPLSMVIVDAILKDPKYIGESASVGDSVWDSVGDSVRASVRGQRWGQRLGHVWASVGDSVRDSVGDSVWDSVRDSVWDSVWDSVRDSVWDSVRDSVGDSVRDSVWASVGDSVGDSVWDSVRASVWDSVWDSVRDSVRASVYGQHDANWLGFYNYFQEQCNLEVCNKLQPLMDLAKNSNWWIPREGIALLSHKPTTCTVDDKGRLHNIEKMAIEYKDGFGVYAIHGVRFDLDGVLFHKIIENKLTFKEILGIENMEQRMIALKLRGAENLLVESNAKLINKSDRGNELYLLKDIFPEPAYYLKYNCPSTARTYVSGIDPEIGIEANADKAMAWKFSLNLSEYQRLKWEA